MNRNYLDTDSPAYHGGFTLDAETKAKKEAEFKIKLNSVYGIQKKNASFIQFLQYAFHANRRHKLYLKPPLMEINYEKWYYKNRFCFWMLKRFIAGDCLKCCLFCKHYYECKADDYAEWKQEYDD